MNSQVNLDLLKGHSTRFDLHEQMSRAKTAKTTLNHQGKTAINYKKIPDGKPIFGLTQGSYEQHLREGDWAIVEVSGTKYYYEILKVNPRTLIVEKEEWKDGRVIRYPAKIKRISGAIKVVSPS